MYQFDSKREIVTKERAIELTAEKVDLESFSSIQLSGKSFTLEAAHVMADVIGKMKNLKVVDFTDIIAGRPEVEALEVLHVMTSPLATLEVECLYLSSNALGLKGIKAVEVALSGLCKSLKKLYLGNDGLESAAIDHVRSCLLSNSEVILLERLDVRRNCLADPGAESVANLVSKAPQLMELVVSGDRFQSKGCLRLSQSLHTHRGLVNLDLSDNNFGANFEAVKSLCTVIHNNQGLKVLNISATSLETEGTRAIMKAILKSKCNLELLDLSLNDYTSEVCSFVAAVIKQQTNLRTLSLEENQIRNNGADVIFNSLMGLESLESCNLSSTQLNQTSLKHLQSFLQSSKSVKLKKLTKVELNSNHFSDELCEEISAFSNGITVSLDDNDFEAYDEADEELELEDVIIDETDELVDAVSSLKL